MADCWSCGSAVCSPGCPKLGGDVILERRCETEMEWAAYEAGLAASADQVGLLHLFIEQDESGPWRWRVCYWNSVRVVLEYGYWQQACSGVNATRRHAEAEGRRALINYAAGNEMFAWPSKHLDRWRVT